MTIEDYCTQLDLTRSDTPLVGRQRELAALRASFNAGHRLLFLVEERRGAGGTRLIRELAATRLLCDDAFFAVDPARLLGTHYPTILALAGFLGEVDEDFTGVLIFSGMQALLAHDQLYDETHARGQAVVASILRSVLERCPGLRILVCCTAAEHDRYVVRTALGHGAARVQLDALGVEETVEVLRAVATSRWPGLDISPETLRQAAVEGELDPEVALPGAAVELLGGGVARGLADGRLAIGPADIQATADSRHRLASPPDRVELSRPERGLDRVVLPRELVRQLRELIAASEARSRLASWGFDRHVLGHAATALFFGEPGTGKSLAAEAVARELGRPLCRVDGAGATSKWLGESEKIIRDIFRFAAAQEAVLLIDEADALLGRRAPLERGADRWSNGIVDQLLQEIDRHEGVAILTTNLEQQLDPALRRRLSFRLQFPLPDARARARIWRVLLPARAPVAADVDLAALGREFELSGGLIRNAVVRAALRAASAGPTRRVISMSVLRGAAREQLTGGEPAREPAGFRLPPRRGVAARGLQLAARQRLCEGEG